MYLLGSNVPETEVAGLCAQVTKAIEGNGGTEIVENQLGKKKLAYPIKKTRNGYYVVVNFVMDGVKLQALDAKIRSMDTNIIRYILINLEEHLNRIEKDKALALKKGRKIPTPEAEDKPKTKVKTEASTPKPTIKLEEIDEKTLDEKIEKALSEDMTK
jgi:small subunit ribosomal protein S6